MSSGEAHVFFVSIGSGSVCVWWGGSNSRNLLTMVVGRDKVFDRVVILYQSLKYLIKLVGKQ